MIQRFSLSAQRNDRAGWARFWRVRGSFLFLSLLMITGGLQGQTSDFGDYSSFLSASSTRNATLRLGATVDAESSATVNGTASGDDTTGGDDEDGVTFPAMLMQGAVSSLTINVTNTRGSTAYLNAWIDFNNNGVLTDTGEQVATNTTISNGTSNLNRTVNFTVPTTAFAGNIALRVRLTSISSPGPGGADGIGEVEDHLMTITPGFALVVVNYNNNTISRFSGANGTHLSTWTPTGLSAPNYGYRLSDNTFLVANGSSNTITKYNPFTGAYLGTLVSSGSGLNFPYQMAVGPDGSIFIANQNADNVLRFNQTTGAVMSTVLTTNNPAGLVFDSTGQMYVTQNISGGKLLLYSSAGVLQSTIATWPSGESPRGLAWGPDGRLYVNVSTSTTGRVDALEFPTRTRTTFVTLDSGSNPYTGIKWGPDGNLYVVDYGEDELHVYSPTGAAVRTITTSLSGPHAIAFTDLAAGSTQDFGDYSGFGSASSTWNTTLRLGNENDTEAAPRLSDSANGDDIDDIDDEEGVTLQETMPAGSVGSVVVKRLNTSGAVAYLNGWIDFNRNGVLTDSGEQIIVNQTVATGTNGINQAYSFNVPSGASLGDAGARFRLTSTSNPGPLGASGNGEVEDYLVTLAAAVLDFGDHSSLPFAGSTVNSNLRLGTLVDSEASAVTNATATADDTTGTDDEDGVTVPTSVQQGTAGSLSAVVSNATGSTAFLNAWIDWNNNGSLTDAGEQIASNTTISTGLTNTTRTLNFTVPSTAAVGQVAVRVRLTSVSSPGPDGNDGTGEVEDYTVTLSPNLGLGNLVWNDANDNGLFDAGESGINNVQVELWSPGQDNLIGGAGVNADTKLATTVTAGGGVYAFTGLTAGRYFVKVPTPPLSRSSSVVDATDNGQDLDNDGAQPGGSATSAYSGVVQLAVGAEPGSAGGGNVDNTIDFGFVANVGSPFVCDNRFYIMQNAETSAGSGIWDTTLYYIGAGQTLEPIFIFSGKKLNGLAAYGGYLYCVDQNGNHLYRVNSLGTLVDMGVIDGLPSPGSSGQWSGATALTTGQMILNLFSNSSTTLYTIDLGSASLVGSGVVCKYASTGQAMTGNFGDIVWDPLTTKMYGYNTVDSAQLGLFEINPNSGVCTRVAAATVSSFGSLVIDANGLAYGYGSQGSSGVQDTLYVFNRTNGILNGSLTAVGSGPSVSNSDGAACPGAAPSMKLGNLVWHDADDDGIKDSGEAGINGVQVRLFLGGENPLTATPAATVTTAGGGLFSFENLSPGQYFLYIPTPPATYPLSSTVTDTADNGQDGDDNGIQIQQGQPVRSPLISLVAGTEPTTDGDTDNNTDLTLDFGFRSCSAINVSGTPGSATVGKVMTHTFSAVGGSAPYTWSVVSGTLPAGLLLSEGGALSGTPTTSNGSGVSVTVRATDAVGCQGNMTVTLVVLPNLDFGDYTAFPSASSVSNTTLRIGLLTDAEATATTNTTATGDDVTGSDDEDGVVVPALLEQGRASSITVTVTNSTGSSALLNAWVDFNRNGSLSDAGEQIATNVSVANGSANVARVLNFTVPVSASVGASALRVRLTSVSSPGTDGTDGNGEVEDHAVTISPPLLDFGDYASFAQASNTASMNLRLGSTVDAEPAATMNSIATGDDTTGSDDEDAVTFPAMTAGQPVTLTVPVTNLTGSAAFLNAWIDFNNDGDLLDAGEQIVSNLTVSNGANNLALSLDFTVPTNAVTAATNVGARFRLTSASAPGPTGDAGVGEVEDYAVVILAPITDFGDWDRGVTVSNTADSRLRLGASVDAEYAATTNASATGDDVTGVDDEDGVTFPTLIAGAPVTINIVRTNTTGAVGYVNAWMDFNNNGSFTDSGEQVLTNSSLAGNIADAVQNLGLTIPANAVTGTPIGARFRISQLASPGTGGAGGTGEVEDYVVTIDAPTTDFGDFSLFGSASSNRLAGLRLGAAIDTEYSPTVNATATGDDNTGGDDEDGLVFSSMIAGAPSVMTATVTNTTGVVSYLNAWIDFNGNGVVTDAGEQIITNAAVNAGVTGSVMNLNFNVPATSLTGVNLGTRVRLTSVSGAASVGAAGSGEVEDGVAMVAAPTTDFGDYSGFADASQGVSPSLRMGLTIDAEYASTRNGTATGDDVTGADDEDGVTLPAFTAGGPVAASVLVTNTTGALGYLNVWVDFNNNGLLTDPGEQVASNINVVTGTSNGTIPINFTVPANAVTGVNVGVRFRLSAPLSPGPVGANLAVGELEDYAVTIAAPTTDFGDYSSFLPASSTVEATLKMGALVDTEFAGTTNALATGDDTTGSDDEDGVTLPSLAAGGTYTIPVVVTNNRGSSAFLNAWVDFNNNGSLTDAGEQIATNVVVANGTNNVTLNLTGTVPLSATTGVNVGLRFRLTSLSSPNAVGAAGAGEVEDYVTNIIAPTHDFGDWSGLADASNGMSNNLKLGALVDAEIVSNRNATATGDDTVGVDDEDGAVLPSMTAGETVVIPLTVTNTTGSGAFLNAWIDLNNNGALTDVGEQFLVNRTVATGSNGSVINLNLAVPPTAATGTPVGLRFRLTTTASPGVTGSAGGVGEVEDYVVTIQAPTTDFGDYSGLGSAVSTRDANLRLGALSDAEFLVMSNAAANADDLAGEDDEDGAIIPTLMAGAPTTIPVQVTNNRGVPAYLNAWIDYNADQDVLDAGEQIATNIVIPTGTTNAIQNLTFTVPSGAVTTTTLGIRFRLTDVQSPAPVGAAGVGEVEDYVVLISVPPSDFGDWSGAADAFSTVNDGLRLGYLRDTEYVSTLNATATGDDNTGADDEDGVTLPSFVAGAPATIPVIVTNLFRDNAYLNVWMDFNNNGSFADAGEQVATNVLFVTGQANVTHNVALIVPATAVTGSTIGIRFRLTDLFDAASTGAAGFGEVEDYTTTIAVPTTDFGDWDGAADASSIASSNLRLGALADTEYVSTRNSAATGDDATGSDDEDGVTVPSSLNQGGSGTITAMLTNNLGASAYLNAWVDFNGNGSFADAGEQIATNTLISTGSNGLVRSLNFTTPAAAKPGLRGVRVRLTSVQSPGPTGAAGTGEVEDTLVRVNCPTLTMTPAILAVPVVGMTYEQGISITGVAAPYNFNLMLGALPAGITLSPAGVLQGKATNTATVSFTLLATDANGCLVTREYSLTPVCPAITVGPTTLPAPVVGSAYSQSITATGGTAGYTFALASGSLPPGLALASDTGLISGTTTQAGAVSFVVRVTDLYGCVATQSYTVTPTCPAITLTPSSLPAPVTGVFYSQSVSASGGLAGYTYTLSSGTLPQGLSLGNGGVISGTPVSTSSATFIVRVVDSRGCAGTRAFALTPVCPAVVVQTTSLPLGYLGTAYNVTLSAGAGTAPYQWSVTSGSLPAGLMLSPEGLLSGAPTSQTGSTFTVQARDANGCVATRSLSFVMGGLSLGNRVWLDNNNNGLQEVSENGVAGTTVQLFRPGTDNAIGGTGGAADTQVGANLTTLANGAYSFTNLPPGNYYVKVTPPAGYTHSGGVPVTSDNNVEGNNDGAQPGGVGTALFSPIIALQPGSESTADGDLDADTNYTVDFGLWAPLAVGNRVFMDINGDGRMNPNEGVEYAYVQIFKAGADVNVDEAVSATISDEGGRYLLTDLNPGSYFLHLAAIQFEYGGVLQWATPLAEATAGDDDLGQKLLYNGTPVTNGASTAVFTIVPGQLAAGTAESGADGMADDESLDANMDLTFDLGLECLDCSSFNLAMRESAPPPVEADVLEPGLSSGLTTFASWQEAYGLSDQGGPMDNPDADFYPNLLEYALGTDPANGASGAGRFKLETQAATGTVDVVVTLPMAGRRDMMLTLEVSEDAQTWAAVGLSPEGSFNALGEQTLRYAQVDSRLFAGAARGLVRLKVSLDANLDGRAEAFAVTPGWMFSRETFGKGTRSFSMPLQQPESYAGMVNEALGDRSLRLKALSGLTLGAPAVLEVLDGPHMGDRFVVTQLEGDRVTVAASLPAGMLGARVALRALWTVDSLLPVDLFAQGSSSETTDRVLRYDAVSHDFVPVLPGVAGWAAADGQAVTLGHDEAMLVQVRGQDVSVVVTGQVPAFAAALKPESGARFIGSQRVVDTAPVGLGLTTDAGFPTAAEPAAATRIRLLKADDDREQSGYDNLYLQLSPMGGRWLREGDPASVDLGLETLLQPFHGFFLVQP